MKTLLIALLYFSLISVTHAGNSIYLEQIGTSTDTTIDIVQDGNDNAVNLTMEGSDNTLDFNQEGTNNTISWVSYWGSGKAWGGDIDGNDNNITIEQHNNTGSDVNRVGMHIQSNDNTVTVDLHSGGNVIKIGQETGTGNADHYAQIYTYGGENNNTFVKQKGNGNKTLNMTIRTDGGTQYVMQKENGAHTATIDLTGTYHTDLTLTQQSSTNQSYTLTQNCQTVGGCTVGVTQGN